MLEKLKHDITLKLENADYFKGQELPAVDFAPAPAHTGADISLVWAMAAAKKLRKNPLAIAQEACKVISEVTGVKTAAALPPGFINVTLEDNMAFLPGVVSRTNHDCLLNLSRLTRPVPYTWPADAVPVWVTA